MVVGERRWWQDGFSAVNSFSFTSHWNLDKQLNARNNWQVANLQLDLFRPTQKFKVQNKISFFIEYVLIAVPLLYRKFYLLLVWSHGAV